MSDNSTTPMRTRIAPSPTGIAHVGTAWMSMFDLALARQTGGQFVVRIEDTDRTRFVEGAEEKIYEGLAWLGIEYDEGVQKGGPYAPYKQSERLDIYQKYIQELIEADQAYYCFCTTERLTEMREAQRQAGQITKYDRHCRSIPKEEAQKRVSAGEKAVVRLKVPDDGEIAWIDAIRGEVRFQLNSFDDQVLLKSDGFPTYHFAVVIDDHLMKITHVLRGEEWISSTPKHLLLYKAFNWEVPVFAHMPLIRNADKSKLSKRKNDVSILSYRDKGYLPEALLNFIALLGWSHPEQKEIFSLDEFLRVVSLERVQKTGPIFDTKKLDWMNGVYIRELPPEELKRRLEPYLPSDFPKDRMEQILPLILERLVTLKDVEALSSFFYRSITVDPGQLVKKSTTEEVIAQLEATRSTLETLPNWEVLTLETAIRQLQEAQNYRKSQYFMALRLVMTGQTATPPLFDTISVLGKEQSLSRISTALDLLKPAKTL